MEPNVPRQPIQFRDHGEAGDRPGMGTVGEQGPEDRFRGTRRRTALGVAAQPTFQRRDRGGPVIGTAEKSQSRACGEWR